MHSIRLLALAILVAAMAAADAPDLALGQAALGNVFVAPEPVVLPLETTAERVRWEASDAWHRPAGSGEVVVADGRAEVRPGFAGNGYYTVHLSAIRGGAAIAERTTACAVIPPLPPDLAKDTPYGAMTHFAQGWDTDILPLLAKAGVSSLRDEAYWDHVERKPGAFAFPERFDAYVAAAEKTGIDPLLAMTFGNKHYDGGHAPASDAGRDAYARYGEELLKHWGPRVRWLEVWNEYNGSWCGGEAEQDRPRYYAEMIKALYPRIKALRPDVKVLGCACVLIPMPYIEGIFQHGGLQAMDAVVIHPYRAQPEGVEREVAELQQLIRRYNDGKDKPIWVTETGAMPQPQEWPWERGRQLWDKARLATAQYLARQYALLLSTGTVEKVYWYLARDYNEFKLMGLLRDPTDPAGRYAVAPPYVAYATLIRQLGRCAPLGRAPTARSTYVMGFRRADGGEVRVCWATQPAAIALRTSASVTVTDLMGAAETLSPVDGRVFLTLDASPVYVAGAVTGVDEDPSCAIPGRQATDLLQPFGLDWRWAGAPSGASIAAEGVTAAIAGTAGRLALPGTASDVPGEVAVRFTVRAGGSSVGLGTAHVAIADPLRWRGEARFAAADRLELRLADGSARTGYRLEAVVVDGRETPLPTAIAAGQGLDLAVPTAAVEPYRPLHFAVAARCAGRAAIERRVEASWNPCFRIAATPDGDLGEWRAQPAIDFRAACRTAGGGVDGRAWIGWDDANLYLAADLEGGAGLRCAVAPAGDGRWCERADLSGWWEFAVDAAGACSAPIAPPGAAAPPLPVVRASEGRMRWELALRWSALRGIDPAGGTLRLALAATRGKAVSEWGGGIRMGRTPDAFQTCRLVDPARPLPALATAVATAAALPAAGGGTTVPLADAQDDYAKVQGAGGWWYGFYRGDGGGSGDGKAPDGPYSDDDFRPMTQVQTVWGWTWKGEAAYNEQGPANLHPGVSEGRPVWAVRRWVSSVDGRVRLSGAFSHHGQGDGTGGRILVDGVQVFAALGGDMPFEIDVPVRNGSRVDFCVTPGPGTDISYDTTGFHAAIARVGG